MRGVIAVVLCLAGCDEVLGLDRVGPAVVLEGFTQRRTIRIVSEARSELTDFPVALILEGDADLKTGVNDRTETSSTSSSSASIATEVTSCCGPACRRSRQTARPSSTCTTAVNRRPSTGRAHGRTAMRRSGTSPGPASRWTARETGSR